MKDYSVINGILIGVLVVAIVAFFVLISMTDSPEVRSYSWAKTFCGGKDTDISQFSYIAKGHVYCKDGRQTDVPL